MKKSYIKNKIDPGSQHSLDALIVELSLENPEFGAVRILPLLKQKDINVSASTVYRILKRNGLQNRTKRLARIEAQQAVDTPTPESIEIPPPPLLPTPQPSGQQTSVSEHIVEKVEPPEGLPIPNITQRVTSGRPWFITLIDSVLVFLIVLLGFHTWHNVSQARLEPDLLALKPPAQETVASNPEPVPSPLSDFRMILKRNLFSESRVEKPGHKKAISVEKLAPA